MKKITFDISSFKNDNIRKFLKGISNISCKIQYDILNKVIVVEDVSDSEIDTVIDLIESSNNISSISINNIEESKEAAHENATTVADKTTFSEDNIVIEKVECKSEYIKQLVEKLLKTVYHVLYINKATEQEIGRHIITATTEIHMKYIGKDIVDVSVGDIVTCNYGINLSGEVSGSAINSIVLNVSESGLVYLLPLTTYENTYKKYASMMLSKDDIVSNEMDKSKVYYALLNGGSYINPRRISNVCGKVTPNILSKIMYRLIQVYDFGGFDSTKEVEKKDEKVLLRSTEKSLYDTFKSDFEKIDVSKSREDNINIFLDSVFPDTKERNFLFDSFNVVSNKLTYADLIVSLQQKYTSKSEREIKRILQNEFNSIITSKNPEILKDHPKISIITLIKLFNRVLAFSNLDISI